MSLSALSGTAVKTAFPASTASTSPAEARQLAQLKARDQQVRAHEAAHMAASAGLVRGGATFTYQRGPDGLNYAVGGEVTIDTGSIPGDPAATLAKAQQIQAAALAPADPSSQDLGVAAAAAAMAAQAQQELRRSQSKDQQPGQRLDVFA